MKLEQKNPQAFVKKIAIIIGFHASFPLLRWSKSQINGF